MPGSTAGPSARAEALGRNDNTGKARGAEEAVTKLVPSLRDSHLFPALPRADTLGYYCSALRAGLFSILSYCDPTAIFEVEFRNGL